VGEEEGDELGRLVEASEINEDGAAAMKVEAWWKECSRR
jgi:hypothetical protein